MLKTLIICKLDLLKFIIRGKLFPRLSLINRWRRSRKWSWKKGKRWRTQLFVLKYIIELKLRTALEKSNLVKYSFPTTS